MKKLILLTVFLIAVSCSLSLAQQKRTSYFMQNSTFANSQNPAFNPERGYFNIPFIGGLGYDFGTNGIRLNDILYKQPGTDKLITYMDESIDANTFLSKLKDENTVETNIDLSILGFGFYAGKSFISVDLSMKNTVSGLLPKSFFEFSKLGSGLDGTTYDLKNLSARGQSYLDFSVGGSYPINDKLTIGGRVKILGGLANARIKYDNLSVKMTETEWSVVASGNLDANVSGLEYSTTTKGGKEVLDFDSLNLSPKGLSGFGAGIDLGVSYKLLDKLTLSASVLDLGFINWGANNALSCTSNTNYMFSGFNSDGSDETFEAFNGIEDFIEFTPTKSKSLRTSLKTTINLAGEYEFIEDKLSLGLLSSTQVRQTKTFTELTVAGKFQASDWFTASLSYSVMHSKFQTIGAAVNFTPSFINFFIGTDYFITKMSKQFIPTSQTMGNIYFGIAIPLSKCNAI